MSRTRGEQDEPDEIGCGNEILDPKLMTLRRVRGGRRRRLRAILSNLATDKDKVLLVADVASKR